LLNKIVCGPISSTAISLYFLEKQMEHVAVELEQTPGAVDMDTSKPVLPVVSTIRSLFEIKEPVIEKRPSMNKLKEEQVNVFLDRAANLAAKCQIYEEEFIKRGNKALYECLEYTYDFAVDVFNSPLKKEILQGMRLRVKNTSGKMPSASTPDMTLIVKYVFDGADRQTAHIYSRALRVAYEEDVPVTSLAKYIEDTGGVTAITGTQAEKAQKKLSQDDISERAELLRRAYVARGYLATSPEFIFNEPIVQWTAKTSKSKKANEKESSNEAGDFVVMLAVIDTVTGKYRAVEGNDFGATFEMNMFRHMANRISTDSATLKKNVHAVERAAWGETFEERRVRFEKESEEQKAKVNTKEYQDNLKEQHKRGAETLAKLTQYKPAL
jgi:hypothetical protein